MTTDTIANLLLVALFGSWLLFARSIWGLLFVGNQKKSINLAVFAFAFVSVCFIAIDLLDETRVQFFGAWRIAANLSCISVVTSVGWYLAKSVNHLTIQGISRYSKAKVALSFLAIAMGSWTIVRLHNRLSNYEVFGVGEGIPGSVVSDVHFHGLSDKGRWIDLYNFSSDSNKADAYAKSFESRFAGFSTALIHRGAADSTANCHGWVFTAGQFLLRGTGVDRILEDNGYVVISDPIPGDVIIYRDSYGTILHTGLVQGVLSEGTVIIESKWGIDQRFLHRPEDQPYSDSFQFYRSQRQGHLIEILQINENSPFEGG